VIASARTFRLVHWRDNPKKFRPLPSGLAIGWARSWLLSPEHRAEVLEAFQWLQPGGSPTRGRMNERDLNAFVLPRIERALQSGELLLVERTPVAGWTPPIQEEPKPVDKGTDTGPTTGTKTWIEFQVTDMAGKAIADVKYEAHLPDGTKKTGSTDKDGLVRFDDIDPGICDFKLVEYDGDAVESLDEAKRREKAGGGPAKGADPPPPDSAKDLEDAIADEIYVVAAELKQIGETLLPDHPVRIVDPDSGEQVGKDLVTDDKGVVRAEVPENKPYRIEIVDDSIEPAPAKEFHPDLPMAVLACLFLDATGKPLANEPLEVTSNGDAHPMETDEHGRIHADAPLGPCELKMRKQTFVAHALPAADAGKDANLYRFVVQEEK
jgi:hypothetical protein